LKDFRNQRVLVAAPAYLKKHGVPATPDELSTHACLIVRENSEGEYLSMGGLFKPGTPDEMALQNAIHTRKGIERILRYGFEGGQNFLKVFDGQLGRSGEPDWHLAFELYPLHRAPNVMKIRASVRPLSCMISKCLAMESSVSERFKKNSAPT